MKFSCTSILLIVAMQALPQEIKLSPAIGFGIATGQLRKTFFFAKDLHFGADRPVGSLGVLSMSIGGSSSQFTYSDTVGVHVFVNSSTFTIPIAFRKYNPLSVQSSYFIELGLAPSLQLRERRETRAGRELYRERLHGTARSLAVISSIGYKRAVDGVSSVSLGFNNYLDIMRKDKNSRETLRQNKTVFAIVFYRKLIPKPQTKVIEPL